jgi:hypothetical protein
MTAPVPYVTPPPFQKQSVVTLPPGTTMSGYSSLDPQPGEFYDASSFYSFAYPNALPAVLGVQPHDIRVGILLGQNPPVTVLRDGFAIQGARVVGHQSRGLTWFTMHDTVGGAGIRATGSNVRIDSCYVENVEDGFDFPGDGPSLVPASNPPLATRRANGSFYISNCYGNYIRDDFVQNDAILPGVVYDCLIEGANTGFSERPTTGSGLEGFNALPGSQFICDGVLLKLRPMPGPFVGPATPGDPTVMGHGELWKWDVDANHVLTGVSNQPVIKDCIFYLTQAPNDHGQPTGTCDFPANTVVIGTNNYVVWTGGGPFPGFVPAGVTVTTDTSIWELARLDWLDRHGYLTRHALAPRHLPVDGGSQRAGARFRGIDTLRASSSAAPVIAPVGRFFLPTPNPVSKASPPGRVPNAPYSRRYRALFLTTQIGADITIGADGTIYDNPVTAPATATTYRGGYWAGPLTDAQVAGISAAGFGARIFTASPDMGYYPFLPALDN